ncbi:RHS repeat-associated core domain-containing protein [Pseudomonas chlororaphis]|uniref:RHS repeat-associated core domain-containing protein n=1 Tax=Pseudomonas chlororaphis TaxID=587753 RepID=UPI0015E012B3|nr:RHS repeat-associated core domain-containing protein [Pseudomonas chlororaphis]QLL16006.1 RHS repeat protein [Pseudomonas chlororaphis subsp. aurantiaca]
MSRHSAVPPSDSATQPDLPTAQRCQGTPTLAVVDNRGLMVRTVQYNRTEMEGPLEELITQQTYSVLGHPSSSIDPRLLAEQQLDASVQPNFRYQHSLSGRPLKTHSQDAGALLVVYDCEGGPVWQRNSRDQQQRRTYDSLHRPTTYYEQAANDPEQVSERWFYGEELPVPAANCRGQLLRHYSPAGLSVTPSYSVIGQLLTSEQQFLRDEVLNSDWSGDDPARWNDDLTVQIYTSHWGFNALGIQVHSADAKGNQQRQRLNIAGQLAGSELQLFGHTTAHAVLRTIDYSAAGQVLHEEAGNGVVTDYGYEPQTQRLAALTTSRPELTGRPRLLQALTYQYDPVGNLLSISDGAEPTRYSHNQRVEAASQYSYDALYQLRQASGRENANATQQAQALPPAIVPLWQETGELTHYSRTYTYDRGSNLTTIRHVGLHPYTQQMVVAPTSNRAVQQTLGVTPGDVDSFFDACGNLRELNAGQPLAWNSRNQLQRSTQVVRSGLDDDAEQYWYDGQGQRSCKLATTRTSGTTHTARVYYLPGLELRQTRVQPHVGEPSVSEALQVINAGAAGRQSLRVLHWEQGKPAAIENDQCRYSLDDQIGSSLIELDQRADILTWEEYFPFGGTAVWSARNETETRYKFVRYSGKERDGTGLYYYGFRYYAPWLGRWLNPDPAGTVDGLNLFCMVGNNPITFNDSDGRSKGKMLLRILAQIIQPFAAVREWIGNLLGHNTPQAAPEVQQAIGRELRGKVVTLPPADKLADALIEHFGLEAEQYLDEPKDGKASAFSNGEAMSIGLYTNGEYKSLNKKLRAGKELDQGQLLITKGLSSAFDKADAGKSVVKTFRGTHDGDAFSDVAEGQKGRDAGYLSTSLNAQTAKEFSKNGTLSTVFGKSGLDVSAISIEANEQEILYNKDAEMTVLFSTTDSQDLTKRVLEESALSSESGRQKGMVDALDLPAAPKAQSGNALSQDPRLKLRGLSGRWQRRC